MSRALRVRWLGTVPHRDAHALQQGLFAEGADDWLLLLEHPHVYTLGARADLANVLVPPAEVGAELVKTDRGGDVTYHGPGQLVGYPILSVPGKRGGGMADTVAYVRSVERLVIDTLRDLGLADVGRLGAYPGVWVAPGSPNPRKIAAIGVRLTRGRSMHGFALNVDPDMSFFEHIVPCGITDKAVTSLRAEGIDASMADVVDALVARAVAQWGPGAEGASARGVTTWERADVVWRHRREDLAPFSLGAGPGETVARAPGASPAPIRASAPGSASVTAAEVHGLRHGAAAAEGTSVRLKGRLAQAGVASGLALTERKPEWMRVKLDLGPEYTKLRKTMRDLDLVTVCEEAGCPNIYECWADGTATFMINGERCTRACGFCLVDTRHPEPIDPAEAERVAEAVERMGLAYAVITTVARDDLDDGGASGFVATIEAIRQRTPGVSIEVLISDCKGDPDSLGAIFAARPEVLNHNIETVARLQRAVRPSAGYARSLGVLARAKAEGLTTKSGMIVGMGETDDEVEATLADLRGVGVDIVTIGQYLRPTSNHLPVARWVTPEQFERYRVVGESMGISHVESSPLTRSSYHAKAAASAADIAADGAAAASAGGA